MKLCEVCKYPIEGKCDNPGCEASGNVPQEIVEKRKEQDARRAELEYFNKLRDKSYGS